MTETPKQRARRILDQLPLDAEARKNFDDLLENVTEEECGDMLFVFDGIIEDNPELLNDIIEALEASKEEESE